MSRVRIRPKGTDRAVVGDQIGDDAIAGGIGGWEQLSRPRRTTAVAWTGTPALQWTITIDLDGGPTDQSVETECNLLIEWGRPSDDDDEPPVLVIDAPAGRAPATSRWVLDALDWGEQTRNADGVRVQQEVTLTLTEYVRGAVLKGPAAKARDRGKKHKWVPIGPKNRACKVCKKPRSNKLHTNRGGWSA